MTEWAEASAGGDAEADARGPCGRPMAEPVAGKFTLGAFREERREILWKVPRKNKKDIPHV